MTPSQANAASFGNERRDESSELIRLIETVNQIEPLPMLHEIVEQEANNYRKELEQ